MGLLTIIRKQKLKMRSMRILLLGLDAAGKSTICFQLQKLTTEENNADCTIDDITPTLGFNINTLFVDDFSIDLWDIGGQVTLRKFWSNYFSTVDGLIWVMDVMEFRWEQNWQELYKVIYGRNALFLDAGSHKDGISFQKEMINTTTNINIKNTHTNTNGDTNTIPTTGNEIACVPLEDAASKLDIENILILVNKCDLLLDADHGRITRRVYDTASSLFPKIDIKVQLCSGKTGEGLLPAMHYLTQKYRERYSLV